MEIVNNHSLERMLSVLLVAAACSTCDHKDPGDRNSEERRFAVLTMIVECASHEPIAEKVAVELLSLRNKRDAEKFFRMVAVNIESNSEQIRSTSLLVYECLIALDLSGELPDSLREYREFDWPLTFSLALEDPILQKNRFPTFSQVRP